MENIDEHKINREKLLDFLNSKWKNNLCACCGQNNWHVWDEAYELRAFRWGNMVIWGAPIIPVVPIICNNCGNTLFVNAIMSWVIENKIPSDDKQ